MEQKSIEKPKGSGTRIPTSSRSLSLIRSEVGEKEEKVIRGTTETRYQIFYRVHKKKTKNNNGC